MALSKTVLSENSQAQEDELMAVQAIYPDRFHPIESKAFEVDQSNLLGGRIDVAVDAPVEVTVKIEYKGTASKAEGKQRTVQHLPPVQLVFAFPVQYPSDEPPLVTVQCLWLQRHQLSSLAQHMCSLWVPGEVLLFHVIDWLQAELWNFLNLSETIDVSAFGPGAHSVYEELASYNEREASRQLAESYFLCQICYDNHMGANGFRFYLCGHMFCKTCISEHFATQIEGGAMLKLCCPITSCRRQALPNEVKTMVSPALYSKYDRLLLQATLDSMDDVVYCPRSLCGSAVVREPPEASKDTGQTVANNLAMCSACGFTFCVLCNRTWHGIDYCAPSDVEAMVEAYEAADDEEKERIRAQYGPRVAAAASESLSKKWLQANTKQCPMCKFGIEKNSGCNKMTCHKCNTYFCWLCLQVLDRAKPYAHFRVGPCANLLFEGMEVDDDMEFVPLPF